MSAQREYECAATLLVTAESEDDAYAQLSDSGFASGALFGTVLVLSLDTLEQTGGPREDDDVRL